MRINHPIFNTPNKVELTLEDRPTPKAYSRSTSAETMPMWRVQSEGYKEGRGQLIGLVSRNEGFLDSPDAEFISSGVNSKNPDAVAIGRHGNFFHWGFAVSPTYLTDEAKLVFVNAIHYIAGFDGRGLIARKKQGVMQRASIQRVLEDISEEGYARIVARYEQIRKDDAAEKASIRVRREAGEKLTSSEERRLSYPAIQTPGRFSYVRRFIPKEDWEQIGSDESRIRAYFAENLSYLHPSGRYTLAVDHELKRLGVGNNDPHFLQKTLVAARDAETAEPAMKLLRRYTDESFESAEAWAAWMEDNTGRFFFSESAGYKWLVNSRAERRVLPERGSTGAAPATAGPTLEPSPAQPAVAHLEMKPLGKDRWAVRLRVKILPGWHAYDVVAPDSAYAPMVPKLVLPDGFIQIGDWKRPVAAPYPGDPSVSVFKGAFAFETVVSGRADGASELVCELSYQVCDANMCMPPTKNEFRTVLPRTNPGGRFSADPEYDRLVGQYVKGMRSYLKQRRELLASKAYQDLRAARDQAGIRKLLSGLSHPRDGIAPELQKLADSRKGSVSARRPLLWLVNNGGNPEVVKKAADELIASHLDSEAVGDMLERWVSLMTLRDDATTIFDAVIAGSKNKRAVSEAHWVKAYLSRDEAQQEEARKVILAKFPNSTAALRYEQETFKKERLQVGMTAPDIVGEDIDGTAFKLSDYRGKVVLLDFWGDW